MVSLMHDKLAVWLVAYREISTCLWLVCGCVVCVVLWCGKNVCFGVCLTYHSDTLQHAECLKPVRIF